MKNNKLTLMLITLLFVIATGQAQKITPSSKTLQHVLLFQWNEGADEVSKKQVLDLFKGLPNKIEGLESFEVFDIKASSGQSDSILIFKFLSEKALKEYDEHPDHLKVKEIAPTLLSGFAFHDYWKS